MTLYEINQQLESAITLGFDEETGEIFDESYLDNLMMERDQKIENVGLFIKNITAEAAAIKAEKDALAARQKMLENKADRLKKYLESNLDGEKFTTARIAISWRKSESVVIREGTELPDKYLRFRAPEPDKTALKAALKAGEIVEGVALEQRQNMQIK